MSPQSSLPGGGRTQKEKRARKIGDRNVKGDEKGNPQRGNGRNQNRSLDWEEALKFGGIPEEDGGCLLVSTGIGGGEGRKVQGKTRVQTKEGGGRRGVNLTSTGVTHGGETEEKEI